MNIAKRCIIFFAIILSCTYSFAQQSKIDSLSNLLKKDLPHCTKPCIADTGRVNHLNALAWLLSYNDSDTAIILSTEALQLSEKILANNQDLLMECDIKMGIGVSYYYLGSYNDDNDNYIISMKFYTKAMNLWEELLALKNISSSQIRKIKIHKANTLGYVGIVYRKKADYAKALDYYFKALKLDEEIGNKKEIATDLGNIGIVYHKLKNFPKTLYYYERALKIDEELGNKSGVARHLGNIGGVYGDQKNYTKALVFYFRALEMTQQLKYKPGVARSLGNIGSIYYERKDYSQALEFLLKSLKIKEELGSKALIASGLRTIGSVYSATDKNDEAESYFKRALTMSEEIGSHDDIRLNHECLSNLYKKTGKYSLALEHFQISVNIKDSLYNKEKDKEIASKEITYEFEKKEAQAKAEQEKKDALAEESKKKQKLILIFVSLGLLLVFVFAGFIFRALRIARKQKKLIEEKNKQTEEQKKIIELQKEIVEEKNKDIIDSINYAKRIQDALLKEQDHISSHLPEHFILFKPKDIVSGDFYWALEKENQFYLAAVDCTGHGVPGAFMSMLGVAFLNEITASNELFSPAEILNLLRNKVVKELRQSGKQQETNDGMDMSIIRLDLKTKKLQWAGANNPLYIIKEKNIDEIKPDKQCIGYNDDMQPFVNHEMHLETGTSVYLFTDGYADQFGGVKGKKFKYSQLKNLLLSIYEKPAKEQKVLLDEAFESWKGKLEQIDDVCVIGVRL